MPMSSQAKCDYYPKAKAPRVISGYNRMYTGVALPPTITEQSDTSNRLFKGVAGSGVADSQRVTAQDVKKKAGNAHSFQWTSGGKQCHGFMW